MPTAEQILTSLDSLAMSGLTSHAAEVARIRRLCISGEIDALIDRTGTARIGVMATTLSRTVSPAALDTLAGIELSVLDTCLCNASATAGEQLPSVIIHGGLISAMIFHLELAEICYRVNQALGNAVTIGDEDSVEGGEFSVVAFGASCALDHLSSNGIPLPRIGDVLSSESKERLLLSFVRAVWFIILHEGGHIRLGHHETRDRASALHPALAVAEGMNEFKDDEFAADRYVADMLSSRERAMAIEYLLSPLDMFSALELRLRSAKDTHPMGVNRLSAMLDHVAQFVNPEKLALARPVVERFATRAQKTLRPSTDRISVEVSRQAVEILRDSYIRIEGPPAEKSQSANAQLWDDIAGHWFEGGCAA